MVSVMRVENPQFTESFWIKHEAQAEPTGNVHFHSELEFYYPVSGIKACLLEKRVLEIHPRDMILIYPNQIHKFVRNDEAIYDRHVMVAKMGFWMRSRKIMSCYRCFIRLSVWRSAGSR